MNLKIEFARKMALAYTAVCRPLCQEMKLPQTAFDILMFLYNNPEYKTARDIVEIRNIKANLVSVNVEKLVQDGYIERQAVEKDRRKTELICTQKALPVQKRGRGLQQEFAERLMMGLSDEDQKKLAIYFSQMEKNLDFAGQIVENSPVYYLKCTKNPSAVETIKAQIDQMEAEG